MNGLPRLLVIIGSGELAAQMTRGHRTIARRLLGDRPHGPTRDIRATIIDTPYGFQENADALTESLLDYFGRRIGLSVTVANYRRADDDLVSRETAFARIRDAHFVFSGPGSPSYALRQWEGSAVPGLLADKLLNGGAIIFASAAALTLGRLTAPIYEIYKAGDDPAWLPGLDVLGAIGISAAVIPHYDNAEGGTHDTRYCYLGERRLRMLEEQLPDDGTVILGVDEHTAVMLDLDAQMATVHGRGGVTLRQRGVERRFENGQVLKLQALRSGPMNDALAPARTRRATRDEDADELAVAQRLVELEEERRRIQARERLVDPLIAALLDVRDEARDRGDYSVADGIRERLVSLGVDVRDSVSGSSARLRGKSGKA